MNAKQIIFLFIFCAFYNLNSQNDTLNLIDSIGKKQGHWTLLGKHKPGTCYPANQIIETGFYKDNKKNGIWKEFFCNGNLKNTLTFESGRPSGPATMYYENGKINETGLFKNNRWIGKYYLHFDNGNIQHEFYFNEKGKRDGKQLYFYESGKIAGIGHYKEGKCDSSREYFESGKIAGHSYYKNDKCDSCKFYFKNGKIEKIFYKDSIKIVYNKKAKIVSKTDCKIVECDCYDKEKKSPKNSNDILYNSKREVTGKVTYKNGKKTIKMNKEYYQENLKNVYFMDDTSEFNDSLIQKIKR